MLNSVHYSACSLKKDEYKEMNLGYKMSDPIPGSYIGIKECMEYNIDNDWCQDCNDLSG